jgi:hypothetical protein
MNMTKVIAPRVRIRYLQPMFCSFVQGPSEGQVKFGIKAQARRLNLVRHSRDRDKRKLTWTPGYPQATIHST